MTNAETSTITGQELLRLEQFVWLIDNAGNDRSVGRLKALWEWAGEMAYFQGEANRIGKSIEYVQRGSTLRVLYPQAVEVNA